MTTTTTAVTAREVAVADSKRNARQRQRLLGARPLRHTAPPPRIHRYMRCKQMQCKCRTNALPVHNTCRADCTVLRDDLRLVLCANGFVRVRSRLGAKKSRQDGTGRQSTGLMHCALSRRRKCSAQTHTYAEERRGDHITGISHAMTLPTEPRNALRCSRRVPTRLQQLPIGYSCNQLNRTPSICTRIVSGLGNGEPGEWRRIPPPPKGCGGQ